VIQLLRDEILSSQATTFVLEGFPRHRDQLEAWGKQTASETRIEFCIKLECSEQAMVERLEQRRKDNRSLTADKIEARLRVWRRGTQIVISKLKHRKIPFLEFNTERDEKDVFADAVKTIDDFYQSLRK
jgi:adenylate kinase family enzyme